jgi:hypothetical protein
LYILNDETIDLVIRQISGLTLKGVLERSFCSLKNEEISYFKSNILCNYMESQPVIRKTISNLLNTFFRLGGFESWPQIIEILSKFFINYSVAESALETIGIIIEDSGNLLELNNPSVLLI